MPNDFSARETSEQLTEKLCEKALGGVAQNN
jgi:hypothetical protein